MQKSAILIFIVCSGVIVLSGFIMMMTGESTYATIPGSRVRKGYEGDYTGIQVLIAGAIMASVGIGGYLYKKRTEKEKAADNSDRF